MHQELGSTTHFYYCAWRHGEALFARRRLYVSQQWPAHRKTSKCTGALHCALFSPSWFVHDSNENDWVANDTAEAGVLPSTSVDMPSDPHDLCSASIAVEVWTCMKRPQLKAFKAFDQSKRTSWFNDLRSIISIRDMLLYISLPCRKIRKAKDKVVGGLTSGPGSHLGFLESPIRIGLGAEWEQSRRQLKYLKVTRSNLKQLPCEAHLQEFLRVPHHSLLCIHICIIYTITCILYTIFG